MIKKYSRILFISLSMLQVCSAHGELTESLLLQSPDGEFARNLQEKTEHLENHVFEQIENNIQNQNAPSLESSSNESTQQSQ